MRGLFYNFAMLPLQALGLRALRRDLVGRARGRTLEIGAGTGLNLPFYPATVELTLLEPDPQMAARIGRTAAAGKTLVRGAAEMLPFPDASFDSVVATLVLCSVTDPERAIREAYRVLKPGGQLLLLEHVRRNTRVAGRLLDSMTPIWKHLAAGCHLNRDPEPALRQAGFWIGSERRLWRGLGRIWVLTKSGEAFASPGPHGN